MRLLLVSILVAGVWSALLSGCGDEEEPAVEVGCLLNSDCAFGVSFAGGQDSLKGRIFRIGHFGSHDRGDVIHALATLELTLHAQGWLLRFGAGVGAALAVFAA